MKFMEILDTTQKWAEFLQNFIKTFCERRTQIPKLNSLYDIL